MPKPQEPVALMVSVLGQSGWTSLLLEGVRSLAHNQGKNSLKVPSMQSECAVTNLSLENKALKIT